MEKFYKVSPDSKLYQAEKAFERFGQVLCEVYGKIAEQFGIETTKFCCRVDRLQIVPTENDIKKFEKDFARSNGGQLRTFKTNTAASKAWTKACADAGYEKSATNPRIFLASIFGVYRCRYRLFMVGKELLCSMESEQNFGTPEGFTEIKGSEFYELMEQEE